MSQIPTGFALGPDVETNWVPWFGDPENTLLSLEEEGLVVTTNVDSTDPGDGLVLWSKLPLVGPWSIAFYYTNLGMDVVPTGCDLGSSILWGYRSVAPGWPVNPSVWSTALYRDPSRRPYVTPMVIASAGQGGQITFDIVRDGDPSPTADLEPWIFPGDGSLLPVDLVTSTGMLFKPGVEYRMALDLRGNMLSFHKDAEGEPSESASLTHDVILSSDQRWIGLGIPNGRSCRLRAFTKLVLPPSVSAAGSSSLPVPQEEPRPFPKLPIRDTSPVAWETGLDLSVLDRAAGSAAILDWRTNESTGTVDVVSLELSGYDRDWKAWLSGPILGADGLLGWLADQDLNVSLAIPPWVGDEQADSDPSPNLLALVNGDYDDFHRQMVQKLVRTQARISVLRPMWHGDGDSPWSIASMPTDRTFIDDSGNEYNARGLWMAGFRKLVSLYRELMSTTWIEFSCAQEFAVDTDLTFDDLYPGREYVDIIGTTFIGDSDLLETGIGVATYMAMGTPDRPEGPLSWLACAKSHGVPLAVTGWRMINSGYTIQVDSGVKIRDDDGTVYGTQMLEVMPRDSALWVLAIYRFLRDNGPWIAYETYRNENDSVGDSRLWPADTSPLASATYKTNWRGT